LTEQHGDELRPAGKAFGGTLSSVLLYEYGELGSGKVMEQLIKQACDLYDWVALLWPAFGEFPARNGSPTSIIGGHSSYFRLQEPVLDKSEYRTEFHLHTGMQFDRQLTDATSRTLNRNSPGWLTAIKSLSTEILQTKISFRVSLGEPIPFLPLI
jgi:hypothetical protein